MNACDLQIVIIKECFPTLVASFGALFRLAQICKSSLRLYLSFLRWSFFDLEEDFVFCLFCPPCPCSSSPWGILALYYWSSSCWLYFRFFSLLFLFFFFFLFCWRGASLVCWSFVGPFFCGDFSSYLRFLFFLSFTRLAWLVAYIGPLLLLLFLLNLSFWWFFLSGPLLLLPRFW